MPNTFFFLMYQLIIIISDVTENSKCQEIAFYSNSHRLYAELCVNGLLRLISQMHLNIRKNNYGDEFCLHRSNFIF